MVLLVEWAKQEKLIDQQTVWYKEKWEKGIVLENDKAKLIWDFEYRVRKTNKARRPDLVLEKKEEKSYGFVIKGCPHERNIEIKYKEKIIKYQQLAYETREKRKNHEAKLMPLITGSLGGGVRRIQKNIESILGEKTAAVKVVQEGKRWYSWRVNR